MTSRKKKDYMKVLSITECNICHLDLSDPRRIECGHTFCLHCLGKHVSSSSSCPTCKRPMKPTSGKVENYPVAMEIVHLLQTLQKVASCSNIAGEEEDKTGEEDEYQYVELDTDQDEVKTKTLPQQSKSVMSNDVCDIHGQRLVSVCTTCDDELICDKCSIHSTHNKQEISEHNRHLKRLLEKQRADLLQREKDDVAEEETLQEMIEKQVQQREIIKDEIEEITEEIFTQIHMKKEEMLRPIEEKADEYVKQLTERQEDIKDRLSEFSHISNRIGKLSHDDTTDYSRKAKRLVKQANIALLIENKPVPRYQNIEFTKNDTVLEDLSQLQLGDVRIDEVSIAQDEEGTASDFFPDGEKVYVNDVYPDDVYTYDDSILPPPPAPVRPKPGKSYHPLPTPMAPPTMDVPSLFPRPRPPLPPRPQNQYQNQSPPAAKNEEKIYHDLDDSLSDNTIRNQKHDTEPLEQKEDIPDSHFNPPPLSPFSGTFRKSASKAIDNRAFPQKLLHRVFLPFRPSGFTVVRGSLGHYYTFVTDDYHVKMFRENGDFYRTITDLVRAFDAASQQHGEGLTLLYITDEGRRTGDGSVKVYTSEGEFQKVLVGKLKKPQGISISRVGLVYVCDEVNILVFCPKTGKRKRIISTIGKDPIFVHPLYVMVSATGKILVSDVGTRELKIHDETRKYTDKFKPDEDEGELYTSFTPGMCAEDSSSNYYVIDQERNILYILRGGGRSEKLVLPQKPQGHDGIPTTVSFANDTGNIVVF
ncbi:Tripartite motif-containing protein 10 [Mizuhopecten yessoensis]|uniref:Tripartite motif-containing protein 10 n=1 Tax=Mizuhopecten yessoensis TaxID=6573 RepID=A0A210PJI4_MIZYE|nr:Tripartite motif-containing protein 10 [Mizuhopecten yessoensis]